MQKHQNCEYQDYIFGRNRTETPLHAHSTLLQWPTTTSTGNIGITMTGVKDAVENLRPDATQKIHHQGTRTTDTPAVAGEAHRHRGTTERNPENAGRTHKRRGGIIVRAQAHGVHHKRETQDVLATGAHRPLVEHPAAHTSITCNTDTQQQHQQSLQGLRRHGNSAQHMEYITQRRHAIYARCTPSTSIRPIRRVSQQYSGRERNSEDHYGTCRRGTTRSEYNSRLTNSGFANWRSNWSVVGPLHA